MHCDRQSDRNTDSDDDRQTYTQQQAHNSALAILKYKQTLCARK